MIGIYRLWFRAGYGRADDTLAERGRSGQTQRFGYFAQAGFNRLGGRQAFLRAQRHAGERGADAGPVQGFRRLGPGVECGGEDAAEGVAGPRRATGLISAEPPSRRRPDSAISAPALPRSPRR